VRALEVYRLTGRPITELQTQWDQQRTVYRCTFIGLRHDRQEQSRRTNLRVARMIEAGLVDEVKSLLAEERPLSETARKAVGYAEIIAHLSGEISLARAIEDIRINTRQFAKAQRTWFRRFSATRWIDLTPADTAEAVAERLSQLEDTPWSPSRPT
jgi:tRNA dimethylallyltransferase